MSGRKPQAEENLKAEIAHLQGQIAVLQAMFESERTKCDDLRLQLERARMDGSTSQPAQQSMSANLVRSFSDMTIKQRAVVFATLLDAGYSEIAAAMGVDPTTVKLHLKAALAKLGASNREHLRVHGAALRDELSKLDVATMFGLPLNWMQSQDSSYMEKLRPSRSTLPPAGGKSGEIVKKPSRAR